MGKILVKAAPQIQIGPDGKPQMYYNVGFGGRGGGGNGVRGSTKRGKAAALAGGAIGVLGGLGGESRSLGGFLSNVQVGAMQGSALGRGIADSRLVTSRRRQARADLIEGRKQAQAKDDAQARLRGEEEYAQRPSPFSSFGPYSNIASPKQNFMRRVSRRNMTDFGRQIQQEEGRQNVVAAEQAKREGRERAAMERANLGDDISLLQRVREMNPEALAAVNQAQPVQTTQMSAAPMKAPEGSVINVGNDAEVNASLNDPNNKDHDADLTTSQENLNQFREENPDVQGQGTPDEFERRQGAFQGMKDFLGEQRQ